MTRRCLPFLTFAAVAAIAACGGSSSPSTPDSSTSSSTDMPASAADMASHGDLASAPDLTNPQAENAIIGTLGGSAFGVKDGIAVKATAKGFEFNGQSWVVQLSSFPGACAKQGANAGVANGRLLVFALASTDQSGQATPASKAGTYAIVTAAPPKGSFAAEAFYEADGPDCRKASQAQATSGSVLVTKVGQTEIAGTFDLTFDDGDHVTGRFDAAACASLDPNRTPLATCM